MTNLQSAVRGSCLSFESISPPAVSLQTIGPSRAQRSNSGGHCPSVCEIRDCGRRPWRLDQPARFGEELSAGAFELRAREETRESREMPCPFLNTERVLGGKPPQKSGFRRHLAGSKMPEETFFTAISRWRVVSRRSMPRVFGRGSRSQPAALVSDRDPAHLFLFKLPPFVARWSSASHSV